MKIDELKELGIDQLREHVLTLKRQLFKLRVQLKTGQLTKTHQVKEVRREVAQTKTLLTQQQNVEGLKA